MRLLIFIIVADFINARQDTWIIGDQFISNVISILQDAQNRYELDCNARKATMYLIDCYNVKPFYPLNKTLIEESVGRIFNAFMEGLNDNHYLPKLLIVVIDKDIIDDINVFDYGAHKVLKLHINWLMKNIDIALQCRCLQLIEKQPGAVPYDYWPTIIYVPMIKRMERYPQKSCIAKICALTNKFKELMNDAVAKMQSQNTAYSAVHRTRKFY